MLAKSCFIIGSINITYCKSDFFFLLVYLFISNHEQLESTPRSPGTRLDIEADMQQWNVEPARYLSTSPGNESAAGEGDREEREWTGTTKCTSAGASSEWGVPLGSGLDDWVGVEPAKLIVESDGERNWEEGRRTSGHVDRRGRGMPAGWITMLTWFCWSSALRSSWFPITCLQRFS